MASGNHINNETIFNNDIDNGTHWVLSKSIINSNISSDLSNNITCNSRNQHWLFNNNAQFICIILVVFIAIYIAKYFESEETEPIPILTNVNEEENIQNNEITYVNNYKDIRFRDYHFKHIAQIINDQTEFEYNNEKNYEFDLKNIIFNNINGRILKQNLNTNYIRNTFNKNIKDGKHKFKKATIKYLCRSIDNMNDNWNENDVSKCLYFTEAQIIQNATIDLAIDGETFLMIDRKEWSIPLSVSQRYYTKIETHKMESALSLEPAESDSISIKYDDDDTNEKKIDNNNDKNKSHKYQLMVQNIQTFVLVWILLLHLIQVNIYNVLLIYNLGMNNGDNNDVDEEESKEFDPIDDEEEFIDLNDTHLHHIRRNLKI